MIKAILLDRDGTLNFDPGYVHKVKDFKPQPFVKEGLKLLQDNSYIIFIVSNQSGINRGYFTQEDMMHFNAELLSYLNSIRIKKLYFCPHRPNENCNCRKPETGLAKKIFKEFDIDKSKSWVIGDMTTDAQFAKNIGLKSILVLTGYKGTDGRSDAQPTYIAENMLEAAEKIINEKEM